MMLKKYNKRRKINHQKNRGFSLYLIRMKTFFSSSEDSAKVFRLNVVKGFKDIYIYILKRANRS